MKTSKLDRLLKQQEELESQIKLERAKLQKEERARDTRRKVLAGAAVLDEAEKRDDAGNYVNENFRDGLYALLDRFLTKPYDRVLFELAISAEEEEGLRRARNGTGGDNGSLEPLPEMVAPREEQQRVSA